MPDYTHEYDQTPMKQSGRNPHGKLISTPVAAQPMMVPYTPIRPEETSAYRNFSQVSTPSQPIQGSPYHSSGTFMFSPISSVPQQPILLGTPKTPSRQQQYLLHMQQQDSFSKSTQQLVSSGPSSVDKSHGNVPPYLYTPRRVAAPLPTPSPPLASPQDPFANLMFTPRIARFHAMMPAWSADGSAVGTPIPSNYTAGFPGFSPSETTPSLHTPHNNTNTTHTTLSTPTLTQQQHLQRQLQLESQRAAAFSLLPSTSTSTSASTSASSPLPAQPDLPTPTPPLDYESTAFYGLLHARLPQSLRTQLSQHTLCSFASLMAPAGTSTSTFASSSAAASARAPVAYLPPNLAAECHRVLPLASTLASTLLARIEAYVVAEQHRYAEYLTTVDTYMRHYYETVTAYVAAYAHTVHAHLPHAMPHVVGTGADTSDRNRGTDNFLTSPLASPVDTASPSGIPTPENPENPNSRPSSDLPVPRNTSSGLSSALAEVRSLSPSFAGDITTIPASNSIWLSSNASTTLPSPSACLFSPASTSNSTSAASGLASSLSSVLPRTLTIPPPRPPSPPMLTPAQRQAAEAIISDLSLLRYLTWFTTVTARRAHALAARVLRLATWDARAAAAEVAEAAYHGVLYDLAQYGVSVVFDGALTVETVQGRVGMLQRPAATQAVTDTATGAVVTGTVGIDAGTNTSTVAGTGALTTPTSPRPSRTRRVSHSERPLVSTADILNAYGRTPTGKNDKSGESLGSIPESRERLGKSDLELFSEWGVSSPLQPVLPLSLCGEASKLHTPSLSSSTSSAYTASSPSSSASGTVCDPLAALYDAKVAESVRAGRDMHVAAKYVFGGDVRVRGEKNKRVAAEDHVGRKYDAEWDTQRTSTGSNSGAGTGMNMVCVDVEVEEQQGGAEAKSAMLDDAEVMENKKKSEWCLDDEERKQIDSTPSTPSSTHARTSTLPSPSPSKTISTQAAVTAAKGDGIAAARLTPGDATPTQSLAVDNEASSPSCSSSSPSPHSLSSLLRATDLHHGLFHSPDIALISPVGLISAFPALLSHGFRVHAQGLSPDTAAIDSDACVSTAPDTCLSWPGAGATPMDALRALRAQAMESVATIAGAMTPVQDDESGSMAGDGNECVCGHGCSNEHTTTPAWGSSHVPHISPHTHHHRHHHAHSAIADLTTSFYRGLAHDAHALTFGGERVDAVPLPAAIACRWDAWVPKPWLDDGAAYIGMGVGANTGAGTAAGPNAGMNAGAAVVNGNNGASGNVASGSGGGMGVTDIDRTYMGHCARAVRTHAELIHARAYSGTQTYATPYMHTHMQANSVNVADASTSGTGGVVSAGGIGVDVDVCMAYGCDITTHANTHSTSSSLSTSSFSPLPCTSLLLDPPHSLLANNGLVRTQPYHPYTLTPTHHASGGDSSPPAPPATCRALLADIRAIEREIAAIAKHGGHRRLVEAGRQRKRDEQRESRKEQQGREKNKEAAGTGAVSGKVSGATGDISSKKHATPSKSNPSGRSTTSATHGDTALLDTPTRPLTSSLSRSSSFANTPSSSSLSLSLPLSRASSQLPPHLQELYVHYSCGPPSTTNVNHPNLANPTSNMNTSTGYGNGWGASVGGHAEHAHASFTLHTSTPSLFPSSSSHNLPTHPTAIHTLCNGNYYLLHGHTLPLHPDYDVYSLFLLAHFTHLYADPTHPLGHAVCGFVAWVRARASVLDTHGVDLSLTSANPFSLYVHKSAPVQGQGVGSTRDVARDSGTSAGDNLGNGDTNTVMPANSSLSPTSPSPTAMFTTPPRINERTSAATPACSSVHSRSGTTTTTAVVGAGTPPLKAARLPNHPRALHAHRRTPLSSPAHSTTHTAQQTQPHTGRHALSPPRGAASNSTSTSTCTPASPSASASHATTSSDSADAHSGINGGVDGIGEGPRVNGSRHKATVSTSTSTSTSSASFVSASASTSTGLPCPPSMPPSLAHLAIPTDTPPTSPVLPHSTPKHSSHPHSARSLSIAASPSPPPLAPAPSPTPVIYNALRFPVASSPFCPIPSPATPPLSPAQLAAEVAAVKAFISHTHTLCLELYPHLKDAPLSAALALRALTDAVYTALHDVLLVLYRMASVHDDVALYAATRKLSLHSMQRLGIPEQFRLGSVFPGPDSRVLSLFKRYEASCVREMKRQYTLIAQYHMHTVAAAILNGTPLQPCPVADTLAVAQRFARDLSPLESMLGYITQTPPYYKAVMKLKTLPFLASVQERLECISGIFHLISATVNEWHGEKAKMKREEEKRIRAGEGGSGGALRSIAGAPIFTTDGDADLANTHDSGTAVAKDTAKAKRVQSMVEGELETEVKVDAEVPKVDMCTDDVLLILSFCVIQAQLPCLMSLVHMLNDLMDPSLVLGEQGYCLTTLASCCLYVTSMGEQEQRLEDARSGAFVVDLLREYEVGSDASSAGNCGADVASASGPHTSTSTNAPTSSADNTPAAVLEATPDTAPTVPATVLGTLQHGSSHTQVKTEAAGDDENDTRDDNVDGIFTSPDYKSSTLRSRISSTTSTNSTNNGNDGISSSAGSGVNAARRSFSSPFTPAHPITSFTSTTSAYATSSKPVAVPVVSPSLSSVPMAGLSPVIGSLGSLGSRLRELTQTHTGGSGYCLPGQTHSDATAGVGAGYGVPGPSARAGDCRARLDFDAYDSPRMRGTSSTFTSGFTSTSASTSTSTSISVSVTANGSFQTLPFSPACALNAPLTTAAATAATPTSTSTAASAAHAATTPPTNTTNTTTGITADTASIDTTDATSSSPPSPSPSSSSSSLLSVQLHTYPLATTRQRDPLEQLQEQLQTWLYTRQAQSCLQEQVGTRQVKAEVEQAQGARQMHVLQQVQVGAGEHTHPEVQTQVEIEVEAGVDVDVSLDTDEVDAKAEKHAPRNCADGELEGEDEGEPADNDGDVNCSGSSAGSSSGMFMRSRASSAPVTTTTTAVTNAAIATTAITKAVMPASVVSMTKTKTKPISATVTVNRTPVKPPTFAIPDVLRIWAEVEAAYHFHANQQDPVTDDPESTSSGKPQNSENSSAIVPLSFPSDGKSTSSATTSPQHSFYLRLCVDVTTALLSHCGLSPSGFGTPRSLADSKDKWQLLHDKHGIKTFTKRVPGSDYLLVKATAIFAIHPLILFKLLKNVRNRAYYDPLCVGVEPIGAHDNNSGGGGSGVVDVDSADGVSGTTGAAVSGCEFRCTYFDEPHTRTDTSSSASSAAFHTYRLMYQVRHWLNRSYRDATVLTTNTSLPNGTHVCALRSIEHEDCPPQTPYHRYSVLAEGFVVQPYKHTPNKHAQSARPPVGPSTTTNTTANSNAGAMAAPTTAAPGTPPVHPSRQSTRRTSMDVPGVFVGLPNSKSAEMADLSLGTSTSTSAPGGPSVNPDTGVDAGTATGAGVGAGVTVGIMNGLTLTNHSASLHTTTTTSSSSSSAYPSSTTLSGVTLPQPRAPTSQLYSQLTFVTDIDLRGRGASWLIAAMTSDRGQGMLTGVKDWLQATRSIKGGWGADDVMLRRQQPATPLLTNVNPNTHTSTSTSTD